MDRYRAEYNAATRSWDVIGPDPEPDRRDESDILVASIPEENAGAEQSARAMVDELNAKWKEDNMPNKPSQCCPDDCQEEMRLIVDFLRGRSVPTDFASAVRLAQAVSCVICCGLQQILEAAVPPPVGVQAMVAGQSCHAVALAAAPCTADECADHLELACSTAPQPPAVGTAAAIDWSKIPWRQIVAFLLTILPELFKSQPSAG